MIEFVDKNGRRIQVNAHVVEAVDREKPYSPDKVRQVRSADDEMKTILNRVPDSEFLERP